MQAALNDRPLARHHCDLKARFMTPLERKLPLDVRRRWRRGFMRHVPGNGLVILIVCIVIAAALFSIVRAVQSVSRSANAVSTSHRVINVGENLLSLMQDVETGQRGYLLTADAAFLAPYRAAIAKVAAERRALGALVSYPQQRERLAEIEVRIAEKLAITRRTIELARTGEIEAARAIVASGAGRLSMDRVRHAFAAFLDSESRLLERRRAEMVAAERRATVQALFAIFLTLGAGSLAIVTTRRTAAELAQRINEAARARRRFRATFDQAAVGIAHLAPDGVVLRANSQLCEISGYPRDRLVGSWFESLAHPDDVPAELACRRALLSGARERYHSEYRGIRADGSMLWMSVTASLVRDDEGRPDFFVSVVKDITGRKQTEAKLLSGEAQYRAIYDSAVEAIAVIDARGNIQSVNPAVQHVFGYTAEEMIGRNVAMLMPAPTAHAHDGYLDHYRRTGERAIIGIGREVEGQRKDGSIFPLDLSVAEWRSDGETFFTGIMRDITARKTAERALAEAEARYRLTQEAVRAGNWETDLASFQTTLSRESMRLFGFSGEQDGRFERGELSAIADRADGARARAQFERAVADGRRFESIMRIPLADGSSRWIQMIGQTQYDAAGKPVRMTGLNIDITDRQHAEQALRESEERLRSLQNEFAHLSRVNELGELAAAIAHEINQPLTAITNYMNVGHFALSMIGKGGDAAGPALVEALEVTDLAAEQAVRAGEIVRRLRAFVAKGTGSRRAERIDEIVDTAMALSLVDAQLAGIIVDRHRGAAGAMVEVEAIQVQQVLVNLLRNAIDALVQVPDSDVRQLTITTRLVEAGTFVEVMVRDTGPGILPEVMARLFEPFVTSKAGGMGMGLSLSRRLIEAHGGAIEVGSATGQGATFRFTLPLLTESLSDD